MLSVKQGGIKYHFLSLWYDVELECIIQIEGQLKKRDSTNKKSIRLRLQG